VETQTDVAILIRTSEMRGDHAADVAVAMRSIPGETVEALVARCRLTPTDVIEIRPMQDQVKWKPTT